MKAYFTFLISLVLTSSLFGQENVNPHTIYIHGMVKELYTMTPVPNADIVILREADTLKAGSADSLGMYHFEMDVYEGDHLEIHSHAKHHDTSQNLVVIANAAIEDYHLNIELIYQTVSHTPPRILYERNALNPIPFDPTLYRELLEDNPMMCVNITHAIHPDESQKLIKKRLLKFEKFLIENGFPMKQIDLDFGMHQTNASDGNPRHGETYFEITSVEGHCFQE
ncbi:MAG: hypothetical protein Crog4KO_07430 [Crocinitomicaceae bacterium]